MLHLQANVGALDDRHALEPRQRGPQLAHTHQAWQLQQHAAEQCQHQQRCRHALKPAWGQQAVHEQVGWPGTPLARAQASETKACCCCWGTPGCHLGKAGAGTQAAAEGMRGTCGHAAPGVPHEGGVVGGGAERPLQGPEGAVAVAVWQALDLWVQRAAAEWPAEWRVLLLVYGEGRSTGKDRWWQRVQCQFRWPVWAGMGGAGISGGERGRTDRRVLSITSLLSSTSGEPKGGVDQAGLGPPSWYDPNSSQPAFSGCDVKLVWRCVRGERSAWSLCDPTTPHIAYHVRSSSPGGQDSSLQSSRSTNCPLQSPSKRNSAVAGFVVAVAHMAHVLLARLAAFLSLTETTSQPAGISLPPRLCLLGWGVVVGSGVCGVVGYHYHRGPGFPHSAAGLGGPPPPSSTPAKATFTR